MQTLAVIPAHNETETLPGVIRELRECHPNLEILVVDDASTDGTGDLLPGLGVRWLQLTQHVGLGGAVRAGLRFARMLGHDCVLRLDADGQHLPDEIDRMLEPLADGSADATVGSRFQGPNNYQTTVARRLVHRALAFGLSRLARRPVTDPTSGFWAFGPRALKLLGDHHPRGFSEPELLLFLNRNSMTVQEVPVAMRSRQGGSPSLTLPRAVIALGRTALAMIVVPMRDEVRGRHRA